MGFVQKPSISKVFQDKDPKLGGNLDCGDSYLLWGGSEQYIAPNFGGGSNTGLAVSAGTSNLVLLCSNQIDFYTSGTQRARISATKFTMLGDVEPQGTSGTYDVGSTTQRWKYLYSERADFETDLDCTTAGLDENNGFNTNVDLDGDTTWGSFRYGHQFRTDIEGDGPSNQVTGFRNSLDLRNASHLGTYYYGLNNSVNTFATCNLAGDKVYGAQFRFQANVSNNMNNGTEIASINVTQTWSADPTVPFQPPLLSGAVFNLGTQLLESAGYSHIRINNAARPSGGSAGPTYLYGLYIAEQTQAATTENNWSILTEGGRSSIDGLQTDVLSIYNTFTDLSNYEKFEVSWSGNSAVIGTASDGTGSNRGLKFKTSGTEQIGINSSGHLYPVLANSVSVGTQTQTWNGIFGQTFTVGSYLSQSILASDAADTLALRNSTNAQQFNIYKTYTDASNYERLEIDSSSGFNFNTESVGTGSNQNLSFSRAGSLKYVIGGTFNQFYAEIRPSSNGLYSCGTDALRWSNVYSVDGDFTGDITIDTGVINTGSANAIYLTVGAQQPLVVRNDDSSFRGNVLPKFGGLYDLGSDTRKWQELHCNDASFSGDLVTEAGGNQYIYNTYTDASNYERLEIKWDTNVATIGSQSAGTGTDRNLRIASRLDVADQCAIELEGVGSFPKANFYLDGGLAYVVGTSQFKPNGNRYMGWHNAKWQGVYTKGIVTGIDTFTSGASLSGINHVCLCDASGGAFQLNADSSSVNLGREYTIIKTDSSANAVTVSGFGFQTINGAANVVLSNQYDKVTIVSDGSNWFIVSS